MKIRRENGIEKLRRLLSLKRIVYEEDFEAVVEGAGNDPVGCHAILYIRRGIIHLFFKIKEGPSSHSDIGLAGADRFRAWRTLQMMKKCIPLNFESEMVCFAVTSREASPFSRKEIELAAEDCTNGKSRELPKIMLKEVPEALVTSIFETGLLFGEENIIAKELVCGTVSWDDRMQGLGIKTPAEASLFEEKEVKRRSEILSRTGELIASYAEYCDAESDRLGSIDNYVTDFLKNEKIDGIFPDDYVVAAAGYAALQEIIGTPDDNGGAFLATFQKTQTQYLVESTLGWLSERNEFLEEPEAARIIDQILAIMGL